MIDDDRSITSKDYRENISGDIDDAMAEKRWKCLVRILHYQASSVQDLLDHLLREIIDLSGSKSGYIRRFQQSTGAFVLCSSVDGSREDKDKNHHNAPIDKNLVWERAAETGEVILVNTPLQSGSPEAIPLVAIPILSGDRTVAVIVLSGKTGGYDENDIQQVQLFLEAAWKVAEQKSAEEYERTTRFDLQERIKELSCLSSIGRDAQRISGTGDFCRAVALHLKNAMACPENSFPVITVKGENYYPGAPSPETGNFISSEIGSGNKLYGELKIINSENNNFILPEEQELSDQVAAYLALWLDRKEAEVSLSDSEENLLITLQSIGDGVIATDVKGRVTRMNPVAESLTGWRFADARGRYVDELFSLVNEQTRAKVENPVNEVLATGRVLGLANHTILIGRDGREIQVADSAAPIVDRHGIMHGVVFVFSDVSDRYRLMDQIRINEERYRVLAENTETILWEFDVTNDRWTYVAPQSERILGYKPEEWTNLEFWESNLHDDDRLWASKYCRECTQRGEDHVFEYRFRKKDGNYVWLLDEVRVEMREGKPSRMWGSMKDINFRKQAEIAISENEAKYRTIFETSPDAIYINNLKNEIVDVNDGFTRLTGYTAEEVTGRSSADLGLWENPGDREKFIKLIQDKGFISGYEIKFRNRAGQKKTGLVSARIANMDGEPLVISIARDITSRKNLELLGRVQYQIADAMISSETIENLFDRVREGLGGIFDTSNFTIAFYDENTGKLIAPYEKTRGVPVAEWPAERSLSGIVLRTGRSLIVDRARINEMFESGQIELFGSRAENWLGVPLKTGEKTIGVIIVQSYEDALAYDDSSIEFLESVANQVSSYIEKKRIQLKATRLSRVVEQSPLSIIITDKSGNIEYVNPFFTELTGYSAEEVIGKNPRLLRSGLHDSDFYAQIYKQLFSGNTWSGEMMNIKKSGHEYWEETIISPVFDEKGGIINFVGIAEDITEKKRLIGDLVRSKEKAEESDRLKSAFLANMSHEIRTPMNSIVGFSELLKRNNLPASKRNRYIEIINANADHLLGIIEDIIDISRIESGNIDIGSEPVEVKQLFSSLKERFGPMKPDLDIRYSTGNVSSFTGDGVKISQILSNLIGNALKFTVTGSVEYSVTISGNELLFMVRDTGAGIREEDKQRVFDRFVQGTSTVWMSRSGTGLGLSIAKAYIDLMGGRLWFESEWNKGTTFWFTVPYIPVSESINKRVRPTDRETGNLPAPGLRILVAEDDIPGFMLLHELLKAAGLDIVHAVDGKKAVDLALNKDFDLVLMDIKMPVMDGLEATREIKKAKPELPVVAVSAHAFINEKERAIDAGCSRYITKPVQSAELYKVICEVTG